ncbi:hypothetical protein WKH31_19270 [Metabacillus indicus]|uniref:DUF7878 domain-containing protein n=1 Tax=Metabacillus indicus TaxID=246786 RepID=UPI00317C7C8E
MDKLFNSLEFTYEFTSDSHCIPDCLKTDASTALRIEGLLTIKINGQIYFKADLALLEFYLYLNAWSKKNKKTRSINEFHYYSMEFDEGAILSLLPFGQKARLASIWEEEQMYNVFDLSYVSEKLIDLMDCLEKDIEEYYGLKIKSFIGKVPLKKY